jgi:hypothetical protein
MFTNSVPWIMDLSSDSKRQLAWVIKTEGNNIVNQPLNAKSHDWIDKISNDLFYAKVPVYSFQKNNLTIENIVELLEIFKNSNFIDNSFVKIISDVTIKKSYECLSSSNGKILIDVISCADWPEISNKIINGIFLAANMLCEIFPWAKKNKYVHIQLIPCPINKTFSLNGEWNPIHINSGFSSSHIVIWRRQEILKVAIHELLHLYSIDLSDEYFKNHDIFKIFENNNTPTNNTISEPRWNEGITEALATIIHLSIMRHLYQTDSANLYLMLDLERSHAKLIASLIYNKYLPSESKESTSVFSYFVVKTLLLENLELFQEILEKRSYKLFHQKITPIIAKWHIIKNIKKAPFLCMSAIGL